MDLTLTTPVQYVPRVGPARAKLLKKLGVETVKDLLYYVPFRYDDFSLVSPIARVQPGETVTVEGTITAFKNSFTKTGKKLQEAKITDETGGLDVVWFNQPFLARVMPVGARVRLAGKIDWFGHKVVMTSPAYEIQITPPTPLFKKEGEKGGVTQNLHTGRLVPIYPETEGISSKWLRGRIAFVLEHVLNNVTDVLPDFGLMPLIQAIHAVHFPETKEQADAARHRLAFDELFFLQLRAWEERRVWQETKKSFLCRIDEDEVNSLIQSLPFTLTNDQQLAINDILRDLTRPHPMNRLLEGDVGAGKTVVAMIAMYVVHNNGLQSVLMAPTEILAIQHHETLSKFLSPHGINVGLVTGSRKSQIPNPNDQTNPKFKNKNSKHLELGAWSLGFDMLVGTHALLFDKIKLDRLGLVVIDEQQRFGVVQRSALLETTKRGGTPHMLTMTATPIPRTIARTIMGNLDLSILETIPDGRKKVKTWVVPNEKREKAYQWITKQINENVGQAFVICPLIEESETLATVKSAKAEFNRLKSVFEKFRLGLLHGRMKAKEKNEVLDAFRRGETHILVATPVVEVGIDIPNATIMLIEAAERFGLSQLHQLRGRVGRRELQSYCLLFTQPQFSKTGAGYTEQETLTRLKAMETTHSGPLLAELDLTLRGPGELFGTRQHGIPELKVARWSDTDLIAETQYAVKELVNQDPSLASFPLLREKLEKSTIKQSSAD